MERKFTTYPDYESIAEIAADIHDYLYENECDTNESVIAMVTLVISHCIDENIGKGTFMNFISNSWETMEPDNLPEEMLPTDF